MVHDVMGRLMGGIKDSGSVRWIEKKVKGVSVLRRWGGGCGSGSRLRFSFASRPPERTSGPSSSMSLRTKEVYDT